MPAYKDKRNCWFVSFYTSDSMGRKIKKLKRGFSTKRDALEWERQYQLENAGDLNMNFGQFVNLYFKDMENRIRENTLFSKKIVVETKILPFFENRAINSIKPKDILAWQNSLLAYRNPKGKLYSSSYLKSIHSQLSAIFNHAVRYYGLNSNPSSKIGGFGGDQNQEMLFWTKEEYLKFSYQMMDKPVSYYAFEMLYWTGIRLGELLALTPGDFDFSKGILSITKSYQRLKGRDIITKPKTPRSIRKIQMPSFLTEEMKEYLNSLYKIDSDDRIFCITNSIFPGESYKPDLERDRFEILKLYYDAPKKNSVATSYPQLAKEWDTQKNQGLTPDVFPPSSHFEVWWKCSNGHEWKAPIYSRTSGGNQCPYCHGKRLLPGFNDLKTELPDLVEKYWEFDLNSKQGIFPDQVKKSSTRKVFWRDDKGNVYVCSIASRTRSYRNKMKTQTSGDEKDAK